MSPEDGNGTIVSAGQYVSFDERFTKQAASHSRLTGQCVNAGTIGLFKLDGMSILLLSYLLEN